MYTGPKFIKVAPVNPDHEAIKIAADVIKAGGTIVYPTRCLYGLGVDAFNTGAVAEIYSIKQRSAQKPILILIDHIKWLERLVTRVPEAATVIMEQFWPGKVTLVFEASDAVAPDLTSGSGKIGIRLPGHPVASALVKSIARPITGTSANLSGRQSCRQISDLEPNFTNRLELILDAGPLQGGRGSTVVDVAAGDQPIILREGAISAGEIMAAVGG
jgi:L-threonylcarbamoyladenylate synthase